MYICKCTHIHIYLIKKNTRRVNKNNCKCYFIEVEKKKQRGRGKIEDPHNTLCYLIFTIVICAHSIYAKNKILSEEILTLR